MRKLWIQRINVNLPLAFVLFLGHIQIIRYYLLGGNKQRKEVEHPNQSQNAG